MASRRGGRGLVLITVLGMVSGLVAVAGPAAAAASTADAARATAAQGKGKPRSDSRLSFRLEQLADPAVEALPAAARAQLLSVAPTGPGSIMRTANGDVVVEVTVADTTPGTVDALRAAGASVLHVASTVPVVSVTVPPASLPSLAAVPQVRSVQEALQPMRNSCPTGILSEGVAHMRVDTARTSFPGVDGSGVKVGVLSDSYDKWLAAPTNAATDVASGELPGTANTCGFTTPVSNLVEGPNGNDEGRAMAQIVHDVAPGASLAFATAYSTETMFADNIRALAAAGAKVIVDDFTYFAEPMYQDGVIGKAVEDVSAAGVTYFSSAANSNTIVSGNDVASNEAPAYRPTTCPASVVTAEGSPAGLTCHDFDPGPGTDNTNGISLGGSGRFILGWNEPQYGVGTDLDVFLLNHGTGAVVAFGAANNLPGQANTNNKAFESLVGGATGAYDLVVARYAGTDTPRLKWISVRAPITANEYPVSSGGDVVGPTAFGHNISRSGASVAAVEYTSTSALESFSSRGPALYCWGPVDGITPAAPLRGGCQPATIDLAATDGTLNSFFIGAPPYRFYGTSAAAPHAAAVAALMLQRRPCLTPAQVLRALTNTGQAVGTFGADAVGGGLVDADAALAAAGVGPCTATGSLDLPASPASGWFRSPVVGTVTATDLVDSVASLTCTGATVTDVTGIGGTTATATVTVSAEGVNDVRCSAVDGSGASVPLAPDNAAVRIDTVAPTVAWNPSADTCSAAVGRVCRGVQSAGFTASDSGSGLADPALAAFTRSTATVGAAVSIPSGPVADAAGNIALGVAAGPYQVAAPPTPTMTAPVAPVSLAGSVRVTWRGPAGVTVTTYRLQRAVKAPGGRLGAYADVGGPRTTTSATVPLTAGRGYCFRVLATTSDGLTTGPSAPRCTTRATDDRALLASRGGWLRAVSRTAYLRTVSTSSRIGATLTVPSSRGRSLALVVSKVPGGGSIGVYVRGRRVALVSTGARRAASRVVVPVRVATAGTPVVLRVDVRGSRGVTVDGFASLP